jgi:hypothetical protein
MGKEVLFDWDILKPHGYDFLGLHFINDFFFFDWHIIDDMLDLIIVSTHPLHWHFDSLLHILDVFLLIGHVLYSPDRGQLRHICWDWRSWRNINDALAL